MKKSVALFLTLAMLATLFCGIVPVSAATAEVVSGGEYADAVWKDELIFKTNTANDYVTVDSDEKTLTVTKTVTVATNMNPGGNIDLSGINWKKTGKITLTYETTITDVSDSEVRFGFVPRITTTEGTNKQVTNANGTIDEQAGQCSFNNAAVNTKIYAKSVYYFTTTGITGKIYYKTDASAEYTEKSNFTYTANITADNFKFTALEPYGRTWYSNSENADNTFSVTFSNITLTESYDGAKLQSFSGTYSPDDTLDISIRLPEDYASASLSIGGTEFFSGTSANYPAGAYKVSARLSDLTWCGNMNVVLDIKMNDGTSNQLTSDIRIVKGPNKLSYDLEDFEDDALVYKKSDEISYKTIEGIGRVAGIEKSNSKAQDANWNKQDIDTDYKSGNNYILLQFNGDSYVSGNSCVEIDFDMYMENASSMAGLYIKTNQDNQINGKKYDQTFWDWIYGYGCSNGIETQKNEWAAYVGSWKHVKFVADLVDDLVYIYVDGNYVKSATFGNDNDQQKIDDVTYKSDNYGNSRKLETLKHIGLALKTTDYNKISTSIFVDNVEFKSYVKGDKPAIESISTENGVVTLKFDKAVGGADNAVTLKCGGSNIASSVSYNPETLTITITPAEKLTSPKGTVELTEAVAGYAMSVPVSFDLKLPIFSNPKVDKQNDGSYMATVVVYNDKAADNVGDIYLALYKGSTLAKVAKASVSTVDGTATVPCTITPDDNGEYTVKMFVWDSKLMPLVDVK